jgi:hypothetical protein
MNYSVTFWGNSSHIIYAFRLQKGVIRIIKVSRPRGTCRELLKNKKCFHFNRNIYKFLQFAVKNKDQYKLNYEIHSVNTRQNSNLYQPLFKLTTYKKRVYYFGIKIFNNLPSEIIKKNSHNIKQFSLSLSDFLHSKSFLLWTSILIVLLLGFGFTL